MSNPDEQAGDPAITEDAVRHVARLSRLQLSDAEVAQYTGQLADILGYIAKINELDVEGIEPMAHALDLTNVFREDEPQPGMDVDTALANAPQRSDFVEGSFFRVPKVLGDGPSA